MDALYQSGLIDIETALPAALHSLGCTAHEVQGALKRRREADAAGGDAKDVEATNSAKLTNVDAGLKVAQTEKTREETKAVAASVEKLHAEAKKLAREATAPAQPLGAAPAPAPAPHNS